MGVTAIPAQPPGKGALKEANGAGGKDTLQANGLGLQTQTPPPNYVTTSIAIPDQPHPVPEVPHPQPTSTHPCPLPLPGYRLQAEHGARPEDNTP